MCSHFFTCHLLLLTIRTFNCDTTYVRVGNITRLVKRATQLINYHGKGVKSGHTTIKFTWLPYTISVPTRVSAPLASQIPEIVRVLWWVYYHHCNWVGQYLIVILLSLYFIFLAFNYSLLDSANDKGGAMHRISSYWSQKLLVLNFIKSVPSLFSKIFLFYFFII